VTSCRRRRINRHPDLGTGLISLGRCWPGVTRQLSFSEARWRTCAATGLAFRGGVDAA
jgi:hypothetical protein